jgi:hypothetical protein
MAKGQTPFERDRLTNSSRPGHTVRQNPRNKDFFSMGAPDMLFVNSMLRSQAVIDGSNT